MKVRLNQKTFINLSGLLLLLIILVACSSTGQPEPSAPNEQPAATEEPIAEPTAAPEPTAEQPAPEETTACAEATADNQRLKHEAYGYCFLYPLEYDLFEGEQGAITLYVESLLSVESPSLFLSIQDAAGRTAEQAADDALTGMPADFEIPRSAITIGGEPAVVLDNMPGQDINRRILVVHDGRLYDLTINRIGPDYGEIGQRAEALYQLVTDSFQFVPVVADAPLQAGLECAPETADTVLLRNEAHGYCLLYPAGYTAEQPNEGETVIYVGSLIDVEHPKLFITVEEAGDRTAAQVADELIAEVQTAIPDYEVIRSFGVMLDGVPAELLGKMPGQDLGRQVIFVQNGRLYKLTFVPDDEAAGEIYTEMETLYELVTDSFSFLSTNQP